MPPRTHTSARAHTHTIRPTRGKLKFEAETRACARAKEPKLHVYIRLKAAATTHLITCASHTLNLHAVCSAIYGAKLRGGGSLSLYLSAYIYGLRRWRPIQRRACRVAASAHASLCDDDEQRLTSARTVGAGMCRCGCVCAVYRVRTESFFGEWHCLPDYSQAGIR